MPRQIVDRFNVDGVDYEIEPVIDEFPTEGSPHAVQSGGTYQAIQDAIVPRGDSMEKDSPVAFTSGGAWNYMKWLLESLGGGTRFPATGDIDQKSSDAMWAVCYGIDTTTNGGVFIAGGDSNKTYYSYNGRDWHAPRTSAISADVTEIAYGNGVWVAYTEGSNPVLYYSTDGGVNWFACTGTTNIGTGVLGSVALVYLGGIWITYINTVMYWSTNGKDWNAGTTGAKIISSIDYSGSLYVAVASSSGYIYWSTDGKNWTSIAPATSGMPAEEIYEVKYGGGIWVARTRTGLYWSTDGKNWHASISIPAGYIAGARRDMLLYKNGLWICRGRYYSTDGKNWSTTEYSSSSYPDGVLKYLDDVQLFVCIGAGLWTSTDGIHWDFMPGGQGGWPRVVAYAQGMLVYATQASNNSLCYIPAWLPPVSIAQPST